MVFYFGTQISRRKRSETDNNDQSYLLDGETDVQNISLNLATLIYYQMWGTKCGDPIDDSHNRQR